MRILIGALSGREMGPRRNNCRATWVPMTRACGITTLFLLGDETLECPEVRGDELWLPCPDAYPFLPQRTRWFCRWALEQSDWDYLFKCDDDTYVAASRLAEFNQNGADYIGAEWRVNVGYGSGGAGYFLSRKAAAAVARGLTHIMGAEDLLVGEVLKEAGIPLTVCQRFTPFSSNGHWPKPENDLITGHAWSGEMFASCHAGMVSADSSCRPQM